jgi:hypothetical protein
MLWEVLLVAATGSATQTTPTLPGGIIAWIICNARKRNAIGGWLLFYYWQLYSTVLISAVFFATNIQSYVPENFDSGSRYALLLCAALPGLVLLLAQTIIATISIGVQTADMLLLLRSILGAQVLAGTAEVVIDVFYFPNSQIFGVLLLVQEFLWLLYLLKSARVRHVFSFQDWDTAVQSIYPPKLAAAS